MKRRALVLLSALALLAAAPVPATAPEATDRPLAMVTIESCGKPVAVLVIDTAGGIHQAPHDPQLIQELAKFVGDKHAITAIAPCPNRFPKNGSEQTL